MTPTETNESNDTALVPETAAHEHTHAHSHGPSLSPELMREIAVEVPADEVSKSFRSVIKQYQKQARIPGFRAGKVPESLVRTKFAKELRQEVMERLVSERFRTAIEEQKLQPVSQPQVVEMHLNEGDPLRFKAAFEVMPEFDVSGYDTVKAEKPKVIVTDDEFEGELSHMLERYATVETVEEQRSLADGDWAEIEFKGEVKDLAQTVTAEGAAESSQPITGEDVLIEIGGKNTLPAFTEALRGATAGQELKFEADYPAEFGEQRLAGKSVSYDVKVKGIKKKTFPERDAEFAAQMGDYESWDAFLAKMRENLAERKTDAAENDARNKMLDEIVARYQFPVPESFVQQQIDARLERGLRSLAMQGMKAEDMRKLDFGKLREAQREQALEEVKATLVMDKIAAAEKLTVDDEEAERELLMMSLQLREPIDILRERMIKDGSIQRMRDQILREKTGRMLYEKLAS